MKSYFAYIRVSTVRQGERGSSLQEQRDAIEAYARRNSLTIRAWFEEMETAAKQGRRAFNRMLSDLERNRACGVIIHKIDRSSRNLRDWARLGELMDRGVDVHFVQDNLDLSTRGGRLSADIQAVVAADYIRNLRDEVRKGIRGRLKQGYYPWPAPIGYLNTGPAKAKAIDPVLGPLVKEAFELYGTGCYSIHSLRMHMATRGLRTARQTPLPKSHIAHILHNPFYMGLMRVNATGELFDGNHEPLVSPILFKRVESILRGRQYPRVQIHRYRFRRLIKCAGCRRSLTGEVQKGHIYYRCHSASCRGVSVREDDVEDLIVRELALLRLDDGDIGEIREILGRQMQQLDAELGIRTDAIKRDLAQIHERLERLADAMLDGSIDREMYDGRREALLTRRIELRQALEKDPNSTSAEDVAKRFELAFVALQGYEMGSDDEKRNLLEVLGSNFVADGKKLTFPLYSPFAELRNWGARPMRLADPDRSSNFDAPDA
jgi:site-specific DNA recombinase